MKSLVQGLMSKSKKKQKGMTLVELLAVIVILGIVAAIGTVAIGNIIENSRTDAIERQEDMIEQAARLYYLDTDAAGTAANLADYYEGDLTGWTVTISAAGEIAITRPTP